MISFKTRKIVSIDSAVVITLIEKKKFIDAFTYKFKYTLIVIIDCVDSVGIRIITLGDF